MYGDINMSEEEKSLETWLCDTTGASDIDDAKTRVMRALAAEKQISKIGILSILVGPGGLLNIATTPNLQNIEGFESLEVASLDAQREIMMAMRRARSAQNLAVSDTEQQAETTEVTPDPVPEIVDADVESEEKPTGKRKRRTAKKSTVQSKETTEIEEA
jgi:hypothetical protein